MLPQAAFGYDDSALQLPEQLSGTVEYHWEIDTSAQAGGTLSETIATEVVLHKVSSDAEQAVYALQSGSHHFTGYHDQDVLGCESTADMTFPAAAGSARFFIHKTLLTHSNVVYSWSAQNTPESLTRTVWCPAYLEGPRQVVGSAEPWWPSSLPGVAGKHAVQPWGEAFTGTLAGVEENATYTLTWNLAGAPLKFEPGDRLTPAEKKTIQRYAKAKRKHARSWKELELGCGIGGLLGGGPLAGGCALIGSILEHVKNVEAEELEEIAEDPPRADFTKVTKPRKIEFRHVMARTRDGRALAKNINAYMDNAGEQVGLQRALLTAMERAQGADNAGSSEWWNVQVSAIGRYSQRLATLIKREHRLGRASGKSLRAAGLHGPRASKALSSLTGAPQHAKVTSIFAGLGA